MTIVMTSPLAGAFQARNGERGTRNSGGDPRSAFQLPGSTFVLVDDVFTTGATLAEAARTLAAAGCGAITAVTFGRAVIPDFT